MPDITSPTPGRRPLQLKILVPLFHSDRFHRILDLIAGSIPSIHCHYFFLHVTDSTDAEQIADIYQDIHLHASRHIQPGGFSIRISEGDTLKTVLDSADASGANLILVPYAHSMIPTRFDNLKIVRDLLRKSHVPLIFLPDPHGTTRTYVPVRNILLVSNSRFISRKALADAFRTKRLLDARLHIALKSGKRTERENRSRIDYAIHRYLTRAECNEWSPSTLSMKNMISLAACIRNSDIDMVIVDDCRSEFAGPNHSWRGLYRFIRHMDRPVRVTRSYDQLAFVERKYRNVFNRLSGYELAESATSSRPILSEGTEVLRSGSELLFGIYSRNGIMNILQRYGLNQDLESAGYRDIEIDLDTGDPFRQRIRIFPGTEGPPIPLVDVILRRSNTPGSPETVQSIPAVNGMFLVIEWLQLQDPLRKYHLDMIPLPGQDYPGLGLGWKALFLLKLMAERMGASGLCNFPQFYHTARIFQRYFYFASPEMHGRILALDRDTYPIHSGPVSWAVLHGLVVEKSQKQTSVFKWQSSLQILPLSAQLTAYFKSVEYRREVLKALKEFQFDINRNEFDRLESNGKLYSIPG
ncbi:hypothetical protein JXA40_01785 [bacterium]|nr:hypothetical protein [candidate division CSSED10-310 bacterium]